jgi:hypothetical protein
MVNVNAKAVVEVAQSMPVVLKKTFFKPVKRVKMGEDELDDDQDESYSPRQRSPKASRKRKRKRQRQDKLYRASLCDSIEKKHCTRRSAPDPPRPTLFGISSVTSYALLPLTVNFGAYVVLTLVMLQ